MSISKLLNHSLALDRLILLSPFAADICRRYPKLLPELEVSGRLTRPAVEGEVAEALAAALESYADDEDFFIVFGSSGTGNFCGLSGGT